MTMKRTASLKAGIVATLIVLLTVASIPLLPALTLSRDAYGLFADRPAPDFQLTNTRGQPVSLTDYRGKYVYLMFGFLGCTDICHSQALLFQEINLLADNPDDIHFLFVTMDPEQDTSARLASYFDGRGENFTALRHDSVHEIQKVAAAYRAYFTHQGQQADGGKEISHPGLYFLIDPEGQIRRTYSAAHRVAVLVVEDLKLLEGQS